NIQDWTGFVGQWYDRNWKMVALPLPPEPKPDDKSREAERARRFRAYVKAHGPIMLPEYGGVLTPGFIKAAPVAWFASHHHTADGANTPYSYSYLFAYPIDMPPGAKTLTLPNNNKIRILAVTVAREAGQVSPVQPFYDTMAAVAEK
ncbi:MAG: alpha-mannosidase, partial [Terriglobia bacterium]